jgi:lysophospholipase L1-like esterase
MSSISRTRVAHELKRRSTRHSVFSLVIARGVLLGALAVAGVTAVLLEVDTALVVVVLVAVAVFVASRVQSKHQRLAVVGTVVGGLTIPVAALVGFALAWKQSRLPAFGDQITGALAGTVVMFLLAWIFLLPRWMSDEPKRSRAWVLGWSAGIAVGWLVVPLGVAFVLALTGGGDTLQERFPAVSRLDLVILRTDAGPNIAAGTVRTRGWSVRTFVGDIHGKKVSWRGNQPPTVPEPDADRALLLLPDAGDDPGRWLALADAATPTKSPIFALLPPADAQHLPSWNAALRGRGGGQRAARALPTTDGNSTLVDVALQMSAQSGSAEQDLALAARHRPALLFDTRERFAAPYDVDELLESGKVRLCGAGQTIAKLCLSAVNDAGDLRAGSSSLVFDVSDVERDHIGSVMYVNVTHSGNGWAGRSGDMIYLDYWWYFPYNPAEALGGALCGPGFNVAGVTCWDHQSDWEGVTVVLDADDPDGTPVAVNYAQHEEVTGYTWPALEALWDLPNPVAGRASDRGLFGENIDLTRRPLVFVSRGRHASYPKSCAAAPCPRGAPSRASRRAGNDTSHDGRLGWAQNTVTGCRAVCVAALPSRDRGRKPASWNAFGGAWGTPDCDLGVFCGESDPPRSPAYQPRFGRPWCVVDAFGARDHGAVGPIGAGRCSDRVPSSDELTRTESLIAIGDSYSSGEGAGNYEPDSNRHNDTCHRSPAAWPQRLAEDFELVTLPSLACSGARIRDVLTGRDGHEPERRRSQIERIPSRANVITVTIGGNDMGFGNVIRRCVLGNCASRSIRDRVGADIAQVGRRLPGVYEKLKKAAPNATVIVSTYPRLFPRGSDLKDADGNCAAWKRISAREVDYLNEEVETANAVIAAAAKKADVEFVDVTDAFDGRELRCKGPSYMNRLRILPLETSSSSIHPTADGHARLAEVIGKQLTARGFRAR